MVALLLAKIYFFLNAYDDALNYALQAGKHFELNGSNHSDFIEILINKAIEKYIKGCQEKKFDDHQMEYKKIVDMAIKNSLEEGDFKSPLGISLETCDIELFKKVTNMMNVNKVI